MTPLSGEARAAGRGVIALTLIQAAGRLLAIGFLFAVTRSVLPDQLGRYSTVAGIIVLASFLADFGTTGAITRNVSRDPDAADALLSGTLVFSLALGLFSYAAALVFVVLGSYPREVVGDMAIAGLALPVDGCLTSLLATLDGHGLITRRAVVSFLRLAVISVGGGIAVVLTKEIRWAIGALVLGPSFGLAIATAVVRRKGLWRSWPRIDTDRARRLLVDALPFAILGGVNALILRFDVVFLSALTDTRTTAEYDVAVRTIEALGFIGAAIAAPSLFILSRRLREGDATQARSPYFEAIRLTYLVGLPLSAGLVALHAPIVDAAFGTRYHDAAIPLAILASQLWIGFVAGVQGALLLAGDARRAVPAAGLVAFVVVGLDVALVPAFGGAGAAWAMVAGQVLAVTAFARVIRRRFGLRTPWPSVGMLVSALSTGAVAWYLRYEPLAAVAAGVGTYLVLVVVLRVMGLAELRRLRALVTRAD
jgi:O-antigen/teichoic acid export membrane protein